MISVRLPVSSPVFKALLRRLILLACAPLLLFPPLAVDAQQAGPDVLPALHWRMIGPFRGGRTRAATGVAGQPNLFYVGQVNGGVWKSTDYGRTWEPIFDSQPSQSIGAIAVAPSASNVLYVASGEGLHRPDLSVGDGIYKSSDAGKTWQHLGLRDGQQIPALAVDPRDPNRVFAAVLGHPYGANEERGIFRSTDGGQTWKKILYKDQNTGGSQVLIDPAHPDVVYAALWESRLGPWEDGNQYEGTHGGLFKSTDGGDNWQQLTQGLPENVVQIQVAIAPSLPDRLYATLSTSKESSYGSGKGLGFYRSDDGGRSWYKATDDGRPALKIGGGDLPVPAVDSKDPDIVYSASIVTMRSSDGGKTWTGLRGAPGGDDYQNLWINPDNPNIILLVSDQGALVSVNRGETWSSWYNQPTAQLYHVAITNTFPYQVCAGQQESGSVCISSRGNDGEITYREWHPAGIIEYGYAAPDPLHPGIIYGAGRTEVSKFNSTTGQVQNITPVPVRNPEYRADRTEPILFSPVDPHRLYYAANVLFESENYGQSWQQISPDLSRERSGQPESLAALPAADVTKRRGVIYSLGASFQSTNTLWAGTDDGLVWITRNQGKNWKNVTPPNLTGWSKVTQISASHFDDASAYVSVSRFRIDDLHPYLYRTHDGGVTWQSMSAGLPNSPVNTVREDPVRKGLLFIGTETDVWFSLDDGDHWRPLQFNLPHTSMRDLCIKDDDLIVAAHGRSFWILDDISPLRQLNTLSATAKPSLFRPADAWRVRRSTYTDTPLPVDEPAGENPPDGAVIDYYLPQSIVGSLSLEILDSSNNLVRRYTSTDKPEPSPEDLSKQLIPLVWVRMPKTLPTSAGMHRWVWDLRYPSPRATNYEYPISAVPHDTPRTPQGPLALPGKYQVRLTVNGSAVTAPLKIKIDPRVKASGVDLASLFQLESRLAQLVSSTSEASLEARSLREQIQKQSKTAPLEIRDSLEKMNKQLDVLLSGQPKSATGEESSGLNEVTAAATSLYGEVGQVDAAPTNAQQQAGTHAVKQAGDVLKKWTEVKVVSVPELNRKLQSLQLPELKIDQRPQNTPDNSNEE